ncbi:hypothetical protein KIPB_000702 [Kipferlia bialata]|uniref:Uncharacterized protein n=1 Tax=Kipferlia bialata TaxID=797122 RepID=A0A391NZT9_9EUKA|nr:hypothetical protein KIPB_000702 [Kipferlia bialata]|eukprot:g702.t1
MSAQPPNPAAAQGPCWVTQEIGGPPQARRALLMSNPELMALHNRTKNVPPGGLPPIMMQRAQYYYQMRK